MYSRVKKLFLKSKFMMLVKLGYHDNVDIHCENVDGILTVCAKDTMFLNQDKFWLFINIYVSNKYLLLNFQPFICVGDPLHCQYKDLRWALISSLLLKKKIKKISLPRN